MFLLNGENRHSIDVSDRGFQYGDGLFETLEVVDQKPLFLDRHLNRLIRGCHRLKIPPPEILQLQQEANLICRSTASHAVLKILITRGSGGRGYRQPTQIKPTRLLSLHPYPDYPDFYQSSGIVTSFCQHRLSRNKALAGIKHTNRLEQILARSEWQDEFQEGLMLDDHDNVIEGTMSNLFLVKHGIAYTPTLSHSGVTGIVRQLVIELAQTNQISCQQQAISKNDVLQADEVFVTNSVIGIWPVKQLEQRLFSIGKLTKQFQALFNQARMAEIQK